MPTLHIEHEITDFDTWDTAFARFADLRQQSGVTAQQVRRPVDNDHYVVIDLDFDTVAEADGFLKFLETTVWATPSNSPALVGSPQARVLESVEPKA
ncbi:MAG: hypothetical protein JWQ70_263 [Aeromicrobium sp.]|jgi:hypothetical protein|nr:hypothetical protein [Aeromicrobium sp.]